MKLSCCSSCGQVIPPRNLFRDQPVKRRIYEFIAAHREGVTRQQIMDHVWSDDIDGGPEFANVVSVHIKAMRPTLEHEGLTISCARGPGSTYRLEKAGARGAEE
jgi:DNA-binding response OmpR family regulator